MVPEQEPLRFEAGELAVVLSHYDLGVVESVTAFTKGSRQSPKAGIVSRRGKFLLKRRSDAHAHADRVRFAHDVQAHLRRGDFPAPALMETRSTGRTLLQLRGAIYELFEFIPGTPYRGSIDQTTDAGAVLARFHRLAADLMTRLPIPGGDYHDNHAVRGGLRGVRDQLGGRDGAEALVLDLTRAYQASADRVERCGLQAQPRAVIHADWHPGNMLFLRDRVTGVLDYDSVRVSRRVIDVANGALQFSMVTEGDAPDWPDHMDEDRLVAFLSGYQSATPLELGERRCVPDLMIEAMIAECVPPICRTGRFGDVGGYEFLNMIARKVRWVVDHRDALTSCIQGPGS